MTSDSSSLINTPIHRLEKVLKKHIATGEHCREALTSDNNGGARNRPAPDKDKATNHPNTNQEVLLQ